MLEAVAPIQVFGCVRSDCLTIATPGAATAAIETDQNPFELPPGVRASLKHGGAYRPPLALDGRPGRVTAYSLPLSFGRRRRPASACKWLPGELFEARGRSRLCGNKGGDVEVLPGLRPKIEIRNNTILNSNAGCRIGVLPRSVSDLHPRASAQGSCEP